MITLEDLQNWSPRAARLGPGHDARAVQDILDQAKAALRTGRGPVVSAPLDTVRQGPRVRPSVVGPLLSRLQAEGILVLDPACTTAAYLRPERLVQAEPTWVSEQAQGWAPGGSGVSVEQIEQLRFAPTKFRAGYDQDQVDAFLDQVVAALRSGTTVAAPRFAASTFREGYDQEEVDRALEPLRAAGVIR